MNKLLTTTTFLLMALANVSYVHAQRHVILGSNTQMSDPETITVVMDITVSDLRIRHAKSDGPRPYDCNYGTLEWIELSGPINEDTTEVLKRLFERADHCRIAQHDSKTSGMDIWLNSRGGTLSDGFAIGRLFRELEIETMITLDQECASACAIAFLGGTARTMHGNTSTSTPNQTEARIIFHSPYREASSNMIDCSSREEMAELRNYYEEMLNAGTGELLFNRTMDNCDAAGGWALNPGAAELFGLLKGTDKYR